MSVPISRFRSNLPKTLAPGFVQKQARAARNMCFTQQMADAEPQHGRGQQHSDASKHRPAPKKKAVAAQHGVPRSGRLHGHSRGRTYLAPIKGSSPILQATVIRHQPRHRETTNPTRRQHWVSPEVKHLRRSPTLQALREPVLHDCRVCVHGHRRTRYSLRDGKPPSTGSLAGRDRIQIFRPVVHGWSSRTAAPAANTIRKLQGHRGRPLSYQIR